MKKLIMFLFTVIQFSCYSGWEKYELDEIVKGDSIFCATGITNTEIVAGARKEKTKFITETLVTHKESTIEIVKSEEAIA